MRWLPTLSILFVGLSIGIPAHAEPVDYTIDPIHTRVAFRVGHAGFSKALGTFAGATGTLRFDADDWSTAALALEVPVASLDLGDDDWEKKTLDGTFFDVGKMPLARFVSTAVKPLADNRLAVTGELTIHGITRPVAFEAVFNALKRHPLTFRRTAGFSATLEVSRKEFGMGAWPGVIDDRVEILVELEAQRARGATGQEQDQEQVPTPPQPSPASQGREQGTENPAPAPAPAPAEDDTPAPTPTDDDT